MLNENYPVIGNYDSELQPNNTMPKINDNEKLKEDNQELIETLKQLYELADSWTFGVKFPTLIHVKTIIDKHSKS